MIIQPRDAMFAAFAKNALQVSSEMEMLELRVDRDVTWPAATLFLLGLLLVAFVLGTVSSRDPVGENQQNNRFLWSGLVAHILFWCVCAMAIVTAVLSTRNKDESAKLICGWVGVIFLAMAILTSLGSMSNKEMFTNSSKILSTTSFALAVVAVVFFIIPTTITKHWSYTGTTYPVLVDLGRPWGGFTMVACEFLIIAIMWMVAMNFQEATKQQALHAVLLAILMGFFIAGVVLIADYMSDLIDCDTFDPPNGVSERLREKLHVVERLCVASKLYYTCWAILSTFFFLYGIMLTWVIIWKNSATTSCTGYFMWILPLIAAGVTSLLGLIAFAFSFYSM